MNGAGGAGRPRMSEGTGGEILVLPRARGTPLAFFAM